MLFIMRDQKKMTEKFEFQLGDIVEFGGLKGFVKNSRYGDKLVVEFSPPDYGVFYEIFSREGLYQIYHTEPLLKLIERPKKKKMVKKTVEMWWNVYSNKLTPNIYCYSSKDLAELAATEDRIACVKLTGEYEVEEES